MSMQMVNDPHNRDVEMRRSTPRNHNTLINQPQVELAPDIWRIHWAWKQGSASGSDTEIFSSLEAFERRLFRLLIEQEANSTGSSRSLRFSQWRKLFKVRKRVSEEETMRRVDRIIRVEHLERGEWVLYSFGVIAPSVVYARQES